MRALPRALATLLLLAGVAAAQTTTTSTTLPTFPTVSQPHAITWGEFDVMTGQSCAGATCETPTFSAIGPRAVLFVDCAGTCQVKLQCRVPGFFHDVLIADSGSLTDASTVVALSAPCHTIVGQLLLCAGTCTARAHLTQVPGTS